MFNTRKVAQVAALFAAKQGGTINVLKLMKLLYLADRESINRFGYPITFDNMVSMPHGPVLSRSYDLINDATGGSDGAAWDEWITDRENHDLSVKQQITRDVLDELSDVDIEVIESVWGQFGYMTKWQIRDYTHDNCPEWKDPKGSSLGISEEDVLIALGRSPEEATVLANEIREQRHIDSVFSGL